MLLILHNIFLKRDQVVVYIMYLPDSDGEPSIVYAYSVTICKDERDNNAEVTDIAFIIHNKKCNGT